MTYKDIKHNEEVNELLKKGNQNLGLLGFTDHSQAHCIHVAETAAHILKKFEYSAHDIELAKIAGYMHDIGNAINRTHHAEYGGLLANEILKQYDLNEVTANPTLLFVKDAEVLDRKIGVQKPADLKAWVEALL